MYERILIPLDGSPFSEQILPYAAAVSRSTGAAMALLRIVEKQQDQQDALAYAERMAALFGARGQCVVDGNLAGAIVAEAARVPHTLVALCSHGRTGAMQAVFGSTALAVLRASGAPLMVFRPESATTPAQDTIERVVLPLDGSPESESMIPNAVDLARWLRARIEIVSVVDPSVTPPADIPPSDFGESSYVRSRAEKITREHGVPASWEVLHGDPKEALPRFVHGLSGGRLLAMTTHGRSALQSALAGSVTAACLRKGGVPVYTKLP